MPVYTSLSKLNKQEGELQDLMKKYMPARDRAVGVGDAQIYQALGFNEGADPSVLKKYEQIATMEEEIPEWFITDPDEMKANLGTMARLGGQFAYTFLKGFAEMGKATVSPTTAKEMKYKQMKDLISQYHATKDPYELRQIVAQMESVSPYLTSRHLAHMSSLFQGLLIGVGAGSKMFKNIKEVMKQKKLFAATEGEALWGNWLKEAKKQFKGKDKIPVGVHPKHFVRQAEIALDPWVWSMGVGLATRNIDDIQDKGLKQVVMNVANDPMGTLALFGLSTRGMRTFKNMQDKFKDRPRERQISSETQEIVSEAIAEIEKGRYSEVKPETYNELGTLRNEVLAKMSDKYNEMSKKGIALDNEVGQKMSDIIAGTKRIETLMEIKNLIDTRPEMIDAVLKGDKRAMKQMWFARPNPETKYMFNPEKRSFNELIESVGREVKDRGEKNEFIAQFLDKEGAKRMAAFEEGMKDIYDRYTKNDVNLPIDEFLNALDHSREEAVNYVTGKHPSLKTVFDPFNNELARDMAEFKADISKDVMPKSVKELEASKLPDEMFGKTKEEILQEATEKALAREPKFQDKAFLSVRDLTDDIKYAIEEIFMSQADKVKGITPVVKKMLMKQLAQEMKEMSKGAKNPTEFINNLYKYTKDVFEDKMSIIGMKPSAWNKMAKLYEEGKLSEVDFALAVNMMREFDLNPKSPLRASGFKTNMDGIIENTPRESLPAVFKFMNEINEEILTNRKGRSRQTAKMIELEMMRQKLEEAKEIPAQIKGEITKFWGKLDENYRKELMTKAEEFEKTLKDRFVLEWGEAGRERKFDFKNEGDFHSWLSDIMSMDKFKEEGSLKPALIDMLQKPIEKISDNTGPLFLIKTLDKRNEVLKSLGMDFVQKYVAGVELHIRPVIKDHMLKIQDAQKISEKFRKKGKRVDQVLIRDFMEGFEPESKLNTVEKGIARRLQSILKHWEKYKEIFPHFNAIKNYMRHQVVEGYFRNWFAMSTDMIPKWLNGMKEAEKSWNKSRKNFEVEAAKLERRKGMSGAEKERELQKLKEDIEFTEKRFIYYETAKQEHLNNIERTLAEALDNNKIRQSEYDIAVKQLRENGRVEGKELTEIIERLDEAPYYVRNRISAGTEPIMDMAEHYAYGILRDAGFPVNRMNNLSPASALMMSLKQMKKFRGGKDNIPAYYDRGAMVDWIGQFMRGYSEGKMSANRMNVLRHIFEYDKLQKSLKDVLPFMSEKKIDTSILNRTQNTMKAYKAYDPMQEVLMYLEQTDRGITWNPIAKILNTMKDYIEGNPDLKIKGASKQVSAYLDDVITDLVGRETKSDVAFKGLILGGHIPVFSDLIIKWSAKGKGIRNPEVYRMGNQVFVKGEVFEPHLQKVIKVEGVRAEDMLPKRMVNKTIETAKLLSYMASLGLSPRSSLLNLTQTLSAMSVEQKSTFFGLVPKLETINNAMKGYHKTIKEAMNPKEFKELHRAGLLDQTLRVSTEGMLESSQGLLSKGAKIALFNMTATEYLNRVGMFEYFKLMNKDVFKAMNLSEKMVEVLARDFSDKYNFRVDALNQPNFLRGAGGKVLGHLSTFAYHQARMFGKEMKKTITALPDYTGKLKNTLSKLGKGDWEGFKKSFDNLNNTQRMGALRYIMATMITVYGMQSILGFSIGTVMWNRSLNMPLIKNPLMESMTDIIDALTGEKPFKKTMVGVVENFSPLNVLRKKVGKAAESSDLRYLISNTKEVVDKAGG